MTTSRCQQGSRTVRVLVVVATSACLSACGNAVGTIADGAAPQLTTGAATTTENKVALGLTGAKTTAPTVGTLASASPIAQPTARAASTGTVAPRADAVAGTVAAPAAVAKAADALLATSTPGNSAYRIGSADVIEISVHKVPELSKLVQVGDNGTVNLALVGETMAAGKTAQEVERDLTKVLGAKYLQNPSVSVYIREYNSQRVTVEGAVKTPGLFPIRGKSTLLQILATCGGFTEIADSNVLVFRNVDGKRTAAKFEVNEIRTGESPDPQLHPGDVVVVNTSAGKEAFNNFAKIVPLAKAFSFF